jgi:two-component system copper resistance phosphate regulon response regulator CusR
MRMLLVEDFAPLRESIATGLREEGYAVDVAVDGTEGWWYAANNPYDVVILDLMLPGMSGMAILKGLRKQGGRAAVLILTARDGTEDRVAGLDQGADDYLVKPFAFPELLARIRSIVRRAYGISDPVLRIGNLEINTAAKLVSRDGARIDLTPREYSLLEYLAVRQGEVVTRSEILEHIYDFDADGGSNVVDVYIGYIRRKIDRDGCRPLLHTRRGIGYSLGAVS